MTHPSPDPWRWSMALASSATLTAVLLFTSGADAQIKQPGAHARYSVELEPHALLLWEDNSNNRWGNDSGWGLGLRASIPIVDNGFISSINNSVAIGLGLDWGHRKQWCWRDNRYPGDNCSSRDLWVPVVMQWNFFITRAFSLFGEPGLTIHHTNWTAYDGLCGTANGNCKYSNTGVDPVFFVGGRLGNEKVAFTFRIGWPYASLGASFFL